MQSLHRRIDELVEREELPWQRDGNRVTIYFTRNGRSQAVHLARKDDRYRFYSVVVHADEVKEDRRLLAFRIWRRNGLKPVVLFMLDDRDRVIGLIEQPVASMHTRELGLYLETLARECDRFEYILTGDDTR